MSSKGLELEDYDHYKRRVDPTDREINADRGLQAMHAMLSQVKAFMRANYPHVTHIAGWKIPESGM